MPDGSVFGDETLNRGNYGKNRWEPRYLTRSDVASMVNDKVKVKLKIMNNENDQGIATIDDTVEAWDTRALGADENFVVVADQLHEVDLDKALKIPREEK